MANVFLISDTHFGHEGSIRWVKADGITRVREFANISEMDQLMIDNWNKKVKPEDKVYHLGDVAMNRRHLSTMYALNGRKVLIKGNHDIFKLEDYLPHFYDIRAYHVLDKFILSHVPIHPEQIGRFKGNVHGHLHDKLVLDKWGNPDVTYKSMCVEHTNYTPVELSEVQQYFDAL